MHCLQGCHAYSINEASRFIVLANKKKLFQYAWQATGFVPIREYPLTDTPKSLLCVRNAVIVGYRKHYECLDLISGSATRILDVEREHKMLITEVKILLFKLKSEAVEIRLRYSDPGFSSFTYIRTLLLLDRWWATGSAPMLCCSRWACREWCWRWTRSWLVRAVVVLIMIESVS